MNVNSIQLHPLATAWYAFTNSLKIITKTVCSAKQLVRSQTTMAVDVIQNWLLGLKYDAENEPLFYAGLSNSFSGNLLSEEAPTQQWSVSDQQWPGPILKACVWQWAVIKVKVFSRPYYPKRRTDYLQRSRIEPRVNQGQPAKQWRSTAPNTDRVVSGITGVQSSELHPVRIN